LISGNATSAREHAYTILDADSLNVAASVLLGATATTPEQVDEAIRRLEAARLRFGNDPRPRLALASLYQRKSDPTTAAKFLKEAVSADPRSPEAHALFAAFYATQGNAALAAEETKAAVVMAPPGSQAAAGLRLLSPLRSA
jgi:Tfp pilus assembly protein PilF